MQRTSSSADISTYDGCGEASKKLQFIANFVFLTASLILIGTGKLVVDTHTYVCIYIIKFCIDKIFYRIIGAGLLGFYRLHMLEVITVDFMIVPMVRDLIVLIGLLFSANIIEKLMKIDVKLYILFV